MPICAKPGQPDAFPEDLLERFDLHLELVQGARPGTRELYARHAREFLTTTGLDGVRSLTPRYLFTYIVDHAARGQVGATKLAVSALRSFLKFMAMHGHCGASLVEAVPTLPRWRLSHLPRVLPDEHVNALIDSCDVSTGMGLRDQAMVLCLARLGLRAAEVAQLRLSDIDWRSGTLTITGKARRSSVLPLLPDVGRAIAAYLRHGRLQTPERHVFVQQDRSPRKGTPLTPSAVGRAIFRAWRRSGVAVGSQGTHALRHTLASNLLRGGAELKQIADVLRHRSFDTTVIYTKVDLRSLATVAQPWPGVNS